MDVKGLLKAVGEDGFLKHVSIKNIIYSIGKIVDIFFYNLILALTSDASRYNSKLVPILTIRSDTNERGWNILFFLHRLALMLMSACVTSENQALVTTS